MEQNYLPLFRKYRPQSFKDVVGQESLVKALSNAIELNRIANAYLFCGPRGTGKTSSARILAKSLNCEHGPTLTPCQECASCKDITNATGLDVIEIDAASNRGIQDAKELISKVQYAPINGKYKIFIIDEVHMLSNDAFNALLKTFEEPPKNVIFILATTEPHKVLETIVSRCQRFDLRRITTEDIIKRLREIADIENIKITQEALFTIAKNVSGGLRDSLALLDQVSILGMKDEITKDMIEDLLGKVSFDVLLNLLKDINDENIEQAITDINNIYTKGSEPRNLIENFIEFLRNIILVLNSKEQKTISNFTSLIKEDIEKINSLNFDKDKITKILNTIIEYYKEIKISTNPYLWVELAVISACRLNISSIQNVQSQKQALIQQVVKPVAQTSIQVEKTIEKVIEKPVENAVEKIAPAPAPAQEPTPAPIQEPTPAPAPMPVQAPPAPIFSEEIAQKQDGAEIWANILGAIPSMLARTFYSGVAKLTKVENKKIYLGFINENALAQAKLESKLSSLKQAIASTYADYEIEFIKIDSSTKTIEVKPKTTRPINPAMSAPVNNNTVSQAPSTQNAPKEKEEEQTSAAEKKQFSPEVQSMIEQFNGKIID